MQLYYCFLRYILPIVNKMNLEFQSEKVRIHCYLKLVQDGLKNLMENFVKKHYLDAVNCFEVNEDDERILYPLDKVYFGAKFEELATKVLKPRQPRDLVKENANKQKLAEVKENCLKCYQELCKQIKKRIDHKDDLLTKLSWIDPKKAVTDENPSIIPLHTKFKDAKKIDMEELNSEWQKNSRHKNLMEKFTAMQKEEQRKNKEKNRRKNKGRERKSQSQMRKPITIMKSICCSMMKVKCPHNS